jgi:hypothetical protein
LAIFFSFDFGWGKASQPSNIAMRGIEDPFPSTVCYDDRTSFLREPWKFDHPFFFMKIAAPIPTTANAASARNPGVMLALEITLLSLFTPLGGAAEPPGPMVTALTIGLHGFGSPRTSAPASVQGAGVSGPYGLLSQIELFG